MPAFASLLERLDECPRGIAAWRQYEDVCTDILKHLFVPPLEDPQIRSRTLSGIDVRDAIFPNRNVDQDSVWGQLRHELSARLVLFEFKNYDIEEIGGNQVDQLRNYMTPPMGRLGIMVSSKGPHVNAKIRRNHVFSQEEKVILLLTSDHLRVMLHMKDRGDDPALLVMEEVELFYIQYE